ncbi:MAG: hypothetical protein ABI861_01245 [Panacibacter sp.]
MKNFTASLLTSVIMSSTFAQADSLNNHKVLLDNESKIISWITPQQNAYDEFLHQRWNFIKTSVPNSPGPEPRSSYPQYYFYCAYIIKDVKLQPDTWMNDIGERIPNWFESARLYYAYSGDTLFRGFTSAKRFVLHEVQVDHAGDMGLTYFRLYQFTGEEKYKTAAVNIANTLADKARTGTSTKSVWPYRVVMNTGEVKAEYGANWIGCYALLDNLVKANIGNVIVYKSAMIKAKNFILQFPMKTGYWTDGHTDTDIDSYTYKSNMSASNTKLYMFDHPDFDTAWKKDMPKLIQWTEDNFVTRTVAGEPANQWGANIVGEQDSFMYKMDYQTARYAAECARWYSVSGDESYKDKAYRSLNWVTYCSDANGLAFESPVSKGIHSWWSDCYGEGPRMFYPAMAAVPEWAPQHENHILYSEGILKNVLYSTNKVQYNTTSLNGIEYIKLAFKPAKITLNGTAILMRSDTDQQGYILKDLGDGDYALTIKRVEAGKITITAIE